MRERILVVGGAGYIGSHCAKLLRARGYEPVVFDNLSSGWRDFARFGDFIHGDIRDPFQLDRAFAKVQPSAIMHFAGKIQVGESVIDPIDYYQNNVSGTLNLLEACRKHAVHHFIFSSTAAVYGEPEVVPIPLSARRQPINPYGHSKVMMEQALQDFAVAEPRFSATCFRYFNAAGAHPDGDIGEKHEPETHLIPNALRAVVEGKPMRVFGDDYDTPDGTCVRDYLHVEDLADAHVRALEHPPKPGEVRFFNLGTGQGMSVKAIIDACQRVLDKRIEVIIEGRRPGDPPTLIAGDIEVATQKLGWTPRFSDVDTVVRDAWNWERKRWA